MQIMANAEIVVYSGRVRKPGKQRFEVEYDRQKNSQKPSSSPKPKIRGSKVQRGRQES